jgi:hypothetical protein
VGSSTFIAPGAHGVISNPFDPMTRALQVRSHMHAVNAERTSRQVFMAGLVPATHALLSREDVGAPAQRPRMTIESSCVRQSHRNPL